jgi:hypothetical protein
VWESGSVADDGCQHICDPADFLDEDDLRHGDVDNDDYPPFEDDDEYERDGDCTRCGGERFVECPNPLECTRRHLGGDRFGWGREVCPCGACGGTGKAKDQTVW